MRDLCSLIWYTVVGLVRSRVALQAVGTQGITSLHEATRAVPIVFTVVADPIGAGLVDSLARPGGNTTGFMLFEYTLSAKWPELLKQIAPGVTRAAVPRDPSHRRNWSVCCCPSFGAIGRFGNSRD